MPGSEAGAGRRSVALIWLTAVAVGLPLRLTGLVDDVPTLDEYHPLHAVSREGFLKLASTFGLADRSIPVALYLELLTRTSGLDPIGLRLPFLIGGVVGLFALPLLLRSWIGEIGAAILGSLLAISPMLVYYSRAVRPYGLAAMALMLAILVHQRWIDSGSRRWLAIHVALVALSVWALPVFAPFAAAAPLRSVVSGAVTRDPMRLRRGMTAGGLALGASALLLAPALVSDFDALRARASVVPRTDLAVASALRVLVGTYELPIAVLCVVVAVMAAIRLHDRPWVTDLTAAVLLQAAVILAVMPLGVDEGRILARYLLPAALGGLVLIAALCNRLAASHRRVDRLAAAAVASLAVLGAIRGPLVGWLRPGSDNFASDRLYERLEFDRRPPTVESLSPNYRMLSKLPPGSGTVLEVPFFVYVPRSIPELQSAHLQPVRLAVTREFCSRRRRTMELPEDGRAGFELPWFVWLGDVAAIRSAGVRFVSFHRDAETYVEGLAERHYFYDFERCVREFERLTRAPKVDDGYVTLFDLDGTIDTAPSPGTSPPPVTGLAR